MSEREQPLENAEGVVDHGHLFEVYDLPFFFEMDQVFVLLNHRQVRKDHRQQRDGGWLCET